MALKLWRMFGDFGIALNFLEIALNFLEIALIWLYEGDFGDLLEILGICLKIRRPKRMTCFRMPSQETHSARVWQGCLGPEVYITCVCCLGWSCWCDVDSLHVFLPSISQPEHAGSGSDWLGYVPPSIVKSGPWSMCRSFFQKFFGIR